MTVDEPRERLSLSAGVRRAILALLVTGVYAACSWWPKLLSLAGIDYLGVWFLDIEGALAGSDANALGIDPHGHNRLDVFHRPHLYSSWWYALHTLGLTRADYILVGTVLGGLFLTVALLQVNVRRLSEVFWSTAFLSSPPILFGFIRGNADLAIFIILSLVVPALFSRRASIRWLALLPLLLATGLKFYPAIAGLALLVPTRPRREMLGQLVVLAAGTAMIGYSVFGDLQASLGHYTAEQPTPSFHTFGFLVAAKIWPLPAWWNPALAALFVASAVAWWRLAPKWNAPAAYAREHLMLLLAASLILGCYFTAINYSYRAVFAIWMAPLLWSAWSTSNWAAGFRRLARATGILLVSWLWLDGTACLVSNVGIRPTEGDLIVWTPRFLLAEQSLVVLLVIALLGFLVPFTRDNLRFLFARADLLDESVVTQEDRTSLSGLT